jgi:uncharacterized protein (DUF2062 family)
MAIHMLTGALIAVAIIDTCSTFIQQNITHYWCCMLLIVCFGAVVISVLFCSNVYVCEHYCAVCFTMCSGNVSKYMHNQAKDQIQEGSKCNMTQHSTLILDN